MSLITIQKLKRNGWPDDESLSEIDETLLEKSVGLLDNENEHTTWQEWRLDGKIVKRGAHVRLKRNLVADAIAGMFG